MRTIDREKLKAVGFEWGFDLDDRALERFDLCAKLLTETNKQMNLTSITEPDEIITKHFLDSLLFFKALDPPKAAKNIDVGTGAGFPGLPLLIYREDLNISFLDSTQKKLIYIERVLAEMGLKGETLHLRAEEAGQNPHLRESYDIATARAVASLNILAEYCLPLVKKGGYFVALKAQTAKEESDAAAGALKTLGGRIISQNEFKLGEAGDRNIIVTEKLGPTPKKYPRPAGAIKKKPL